MNSFYEGTSEIVEAVREARPDSQHVADEDATSNLHGRRVNWKGYHYVLEVSVDRVRFMEGNQWHFEHAAGVLQAMRIGHTYKLSFTFELPVARIHRITADDVRYTQKYAKDGELSYQMSMTRPWSSKDIGTYSAQLLDGNHRAAAAMALGEPTIFVYVGENYREQVRKKDWIKSAQKPPSRKSPPRGVRSNPDSVVDGWWCA